MKLPPHPPIPAAKSLQPHGLLQAPFPITCHNIPQYTMIYYRIPKHTRNRPYVNQITGDASFYPPLRKRGRSEPTSQVEPLGPCKYPYKYTDKIGVMLGFYWDNMKKYRVYLGILEKKMETTI